MGYLAWIALEAIWILVDLSRADFSMNQLYPNRGCNKTPKDSSSYLSSVVLL